MRGLRGCESGSMEIFLVGLSPCNSLVSLGCITYLRMPVGEGVGLSHVSCGLVMGDGRWIWLTEYVLRRIWRRGRK